MDYDWKDTLRHKMSGYTEAEPEGLLQDIMKGLDAYPAAPKQAEKSNESGKKAFIRLAGIFSAAAASIALLVIFRQRVPSDSESGAISVIKHNTKEQIASVTPEYPIYENPDLKSLIYLEKDKNTIQAVSALRDREIKNDYTEKKQKTSEGDFLTDSPRDKESSSRQTGQTPKEKWENDFFEEETANKKNKKFSTDIFYSNLAGSVTEAAGYSTMRQIGASAFNGIPDRASVSATPGKETMLLTTGGHSNTTIRHRQPVRIGVSFRYSLTKCWGIETGLVYSFLSSRMETNESQYKSITEQKLHYIGIPVKINWLFLNRQHFSLYLNAGGMLEKCIAGNAVTDYILDEKSISSTKDNISIKPVQWSVNAAAGAQWNISNNIGIYAQPGISYHFNDGSPISTAYKERPLNFTIEIGLRFSFE